MDRLPSKQCTKDCWCVCSPDEVSEGPQTHQVFVTACGFSSARSHPVLPCTAACTSLVFYRAGRGWNPTTAKLSVLLPGWAVTPRVTWALQVPWQETCCCACCFSHHTPLPFLIIISGPFTHAEEKKKSKAILKPSLSSSLFIHCVEWYSEELH